MRAQKGAEPALKHGFRGRRFRRGVAIGRSAPINGFAHRADGDGAPDRLSGSRRAAAVAVAVVARRAGGSGRSAPGRGAGRGRAGESSSTDALPIEPAYQGLLDFFLRLPRHVRHHRPAPSGAHEVPHGRGCLLASSLVGRPAIIGNEVKIAATIVDASLLDFVGAHRIPTTREPGRRSRRPGAERPHPRNLPLLAPDPRAAAHVPSPLGCQGGFTAGPETWASLAACRRGRDGSMS